MSRGVDRRRIFLDDHDRQLYLHLLGGVTRRQGWSCLAYCLMNNHVHLLLQTPEPNLSSGMRRLHGTYAQTFNERYARSGHLFESRFRDRPVASVRGIAAVSSYIAANPVEAGLSATPDGFAWSSHAAIVGGTAPSWLDVDRLAALLGADGGDGTERYLAALAARMEAIREDESPHGRGAQLGRGRQRRRARRLGRGRRRRRARRLGRGRRRRRARRRPTRSARADPRRARRAPPG